MIQDTTRDLERRALAAWFRSGGTDQPKTTIAEVEGKQYVTLRNVNGLLAVYRVRNDGMLRRMRRWPKALAERTP